MSFCLLLLPLWESVTVLCFVVRYFMSILVLQSSWWGRGSWLLCLVCLPGVSWWLSGSSSRCHGVVCGLWLWYFLIILTYYFWLSLKKRKCYFWYELFSLRPEHVKTITKVYITAIKICLLLCCFSYNNVRFSRFKTQIIYHMCCNV